MTTVEVKVISGEDGDEANPGVVEIPLEVAPIVDEEPEIVETDDPGDDELPPSLVVQPALELLLLPVDPVDEEPSVDVDTVGIDDSLTVDDWPLDGVVIIVET